MIVVRFAPSPTGNLHIGGARTALFNWVYAKSQNGKFILRIEDTDLERSKQEFVDEILGSMQWLGLNWDELHFQSKRFDLYREHAKKLIAEDKAYQEGEAVILKMPPKEVKIYDLIRNEIVFDTETLKDQVLMKSDGSPTYSFACVVDDALMGVTHVIRGEDHISNTPKQVIIYEALGFKPPKFAHLPLIMGEDGGRLSKRFGAVAVSDYRKQGFLPDALVNYLLLLGWSPGNNQEVVPMASAIKAFSIKKVNKAAAIFDMDKLLWVNGQYIKNKKSEELAELLIPLLKEKGFIKDGFDRSSLKNIIDLYKGRMSTLADFLDWANFVFTDQIVVDPEAQEHLATNRSAEFTQLASRLEVVETFDAKHLEEAFRQLVVELGIKASDLVHPIRVALTGKAVGPGLFETMAVLGKEKTVERLRNCFK